MRKNRFQKIAESMKAAREIPGPTGIPGDHGDHVGHGVHGVHGGHVGHGGHGHGGHGGHGTLGGHGGHGGHAPKQTVSNANQNYYQIKHALDDDNFCSMFNK